MNAQDEARKKELGRWKKKVEDQGRELAKWKKQAEEAASGAMELNNLLSAILAETAIRYGQPEPDPEDPKNPLGWRLEMPRFSVAETLEKYEQHARVDKEKDLYIIGVVKRQFASRQAEGNEAAASTDTQEKIDDSGAVSEAREGSVC